MSRNDASHLSVNTIHPDAVIINDVVKARGKLGENKPSAMAPKRRHLAIGVANVIPDVNQTVVI